MIKRISRVSYALSIQLILFIGLPVGLSAQSKLQQFDDEVLIGLSHNRTPAKTGFFLFLSNYNDVVNVGVPAGLLAAGIIGKDKEMRQNALYIASSSLTNSLATYFIKKLVKRPRPFLANVKINAVYQPDKFSFPSGHTSSSFTTATALSQSYKKWYIVAPAYLWAGSVSYSRMYLGVHYPTDIAAGAVLGTGTALSFKFLKAD